MGKRAVHYGDIRLHNNGGINMPVCYAAQKGPLDLDKTGLKIANDKKEVTCKNCIRVWPKRYPWAGKIK